MSDEKEKKTIERIELPLLLEQMQQANESVLERINSSDFKGIDINDSVNDISSKYWSQIMPALLNNDGAGFRAIIDKFIDFFFPMGDDFFEVFKKIYSNFFIMESNFDRSLIELQKANIEDFITLMVSPDTKQTLNEDSRKMIESFIEILRNSSTFTISENDLRGISRSASVDHRKYVNVLQKVLHMTEHSVSRRSGKTGKKERIIYYQFPQEIIDFLCKENILRVRSKKDKTYEVIDDQKFNVNLIYAIILAHYAVEEREIMNMYNKIGIISQMVLLFMLSTQQNVSKIIEDNSPAFFNNLMNQGFNANQMQIIPKTWMKDELIDIYLYPLSRLVAYFIGGPNWVSVIAERKVIKRLFKQFLTRLPTINQWKLGQKIRVMIPIMVDVSNILTTIQAGTTGTTSTDED